MQITHPGTDLINGSMTHYIHVIPASLLLIVALACIVNAKHPTDPRWCGIYGAVLRTMDSVRVHETNRRANRALWLLNGQRFAVYI